MADDTLDRIEKQLEGNSLALSAVAEVLQKMDGKLSREEELVLAKQQEMHDTEERTSLIKDIAVEVAGILKGQDTDQGMDVDGEKTRPAAKAGAAKGGDSAAEKPVNPTTKIEEQQATIQAMLKAFAKGEAAEYPDDEEVPTEKKGMKYKAQHNTDEEEEDLEKEGTDEDEDEDLDKQDGEAVEEDDEKDPAKAMAKQLDKMQKQLASYEANMQKAIQTEAEGRLRKMGWHEENSLQSPQRTLPLGVDGTTPLKKAQNPSEVADQLTQLSYKELRDMQFAIEHGQTEGIPRELIGR